MTHSLVGAKRGDNLITSTWQSKQSTCERKSIVSLLNYLVFTEVTCVLCELVYVVEKKCSSSRYECKKQPYYSKYLPHKSLSLPSCSKYRPQSSEPQTDGLSVSTTADGSQPNVRKLCDTPPPAPQAHTHNLAYYDNIICQVCPALLMFGPFPPFFLGFISFFYIFFPLPTSLCSLLCCLPASFA